MGNYYRNGRLYSAETFNVQGTRTLAAATESHLWSGTAATRPTPASEQLRIVSSSIEDDSAKADITDVWDVAVGPAVSAGDVARIAINALNYDYMVNMGDTDAMVALGLSNAIANGSKAVHRLVPAGVLDIGDTFRISIGATDYDHVCGAADTPAIVIAGLVAAVNAGAGDPIYAAINAGTALVLIAKAGGVSTTPVASVPVDTGNDATLTLTTVVTGVAADTNYTPAVMGAGVELTNNAVGVTTDTVTATFSYDPGLDSTCIAVHTVTGAAGPAGTGLRTIRLDYLDAAGVRQAETVPMNGTAAVLTTATGVTAILGVSALTLGSNGSAVGSISITNVANTSTFEVVPAGSCAAASAFYKVPSARQSYVTQISGSAVTSATRIRLCSDTNPTTGLVVPGATFTWESGYFSSNPDDIEPVVPIGPFPAGSSIWLSGYASGGSPVIGALNGYNTPV